MKKYSRVLICFLILISLEGYGQANKYRCYIKNVKKVNQTTMDFDVWIEWTGSNKQKLQSFQGGVDFNYEEIANGGTITGALVPGSVNKAMSVQQGANWNINKTSHQIRMLAKPNPMASLAPAIPKPPGFRLGTFRMKNTVPFTPNIKPKFSWYFGKLSGATTTTKVSFYLGTDEKATDITDKGSHLVKP